MIRSLVLTCCAILGLIVAAVGLGEAEPRADLIYVNPSGIHTLDPARMSWTQDFRVAINLWEGLTTLDPRTLEPAAGAAHFPPAVSEDRHTYTFEIREDARWSNGDKLTAADFARGWRRAIEPGTAADYAFLLTDHIAGAAEYVQWRQSGVAALSAARLLNSEDAPNAVATLLREHAAELDERFSKVGVRAAGPTTLVVELLQPCPYFLDLTALPVFLPCHPSIEELRIRHGDLPITAEGLVVYDPQWTKPDYHENRYPGLVTNGAYRLMDWEFKRRARFAANPFYYQADAMHCKTVDMLEYGNVSASLMAYERGRVHFLTDLNVPYDHELYRLSQSGKRLDFHLCNVSATYFLNFNCTSEEINGAPNPFLDPLVRKAFTLATDRRSIVESVIARGDRVASSFVPPGLDMGYTPPSGLPYSPEQARLALRQAGYASGQSLGAMEFLCTFNDERTAQALARMWEDVLGVQVVIRTQESRTFADEKARHHFAVARGNWYADYGDPTTFLNCLKTGNGNNDAGYSSSRYDALLQEAEAASDKARRAEILRQAEKLIVEKDCPILPILHYTQMVAISPKIHGLHPNGRLWFPFRFAAVDR